MDSREILKELLLRSKKEAMKQAKESVYKVIAPEKVEDLVMELLEKAPPKAIDEVILLCGNSIRGALAKFIAMQSLKNVAEKIVLAEFEGPKQ